MKQGLGAPRPDTMNVVTDSPLVSIIIPAYNEARVIGSVVAGVVSTVEQAGLDAEVLVVDDGSTDGTAAAAEGAGGRVITHPYNIGNGAAVKTGIRRARGDILVMLDGDGQHSPEDIPRLLDKLEKYDMVVGARTSDSETGAHRDLANTVYNWLASYVCGRRIEDLTSGFRAMRANLAQGFVYLLPNTFSYPTTITLATVRSGRSLAYVPIKTAKRVGNSKIKLFRDGLRFLLIVLKIATFFSPLKVFVPASIAMFLTGFGYGLFKVIALGTRYGPTSAMLMTMAILVFLVGLVSEQIAQLRFDRSELDGDLRTTDS
jgi:glycosyltransferase involved in cell wall biosynthesis